MTHAPVVLATLPTDAAAFGGWIVLAYLLGSIPTGLLVARIKGVDIRKVVELGIAPRINTGIAHKNAGVGQVGAGLVRPPLEIFEQALVAFAEKYEI